MKTRKETLKEVLNIIQLELNKINNESKNLKEQNDMAYKLSLCIEKEICDKKYNTVFQIWDTIQDLYIDELAKEYSEEIENRKQYYFTNENFDKKLFINLYYDMINFGCDYTYNSQEWTSAFIDGGLYKVYKYNKLINEIDLKSIKSITFNEVTYNIEG